MSKISEVYAIGTIALRLPVRIFLISIHSSPVFGHTFCSLFNLKSPSVVSLIQSIADYKFQRDSFAHSSRNIQPV